MKLTRNQLRYLIENVAIDANKDIDKVAIANEVGKLLGTYFAKFNEARVAKENVGKILQNLNLSQSIRSIKTFYKGNSGESIFDVMTKDYSFTAQDVIDYFVTKGFIPLLFISVEGTSGTRDNVLETLKNKNKDYDYLIHHSHPDGIIVTLEKNNLLSIDAQKLIASK